MAQARSTLSVADIEQRANWYVLIRFLLLLVIIVPGLTAFYALEGFSKNFKLDTAIAVIAVGSNLLLYGLMRLTRNANYLQLLCIGWIALDVVLIGLFVFDSGPTSVNGRTLFVVPVLIAAVLFARRGIYFTTAWCMVVYFSFALGDPAVADFQYSTVNRLIFFPALLAVIAIAIDFITSLLREKQDELSKTIHALEQAQEVAKVGSWNWDIAKDEITWSKQMFRLYGLEPSNTKLSYDQYLNLNRDGNQAEAHQKTILTAMRNKTRFVVDHQITLPHGDIRYLHGEGRPWTDDKGNVYRMTGTSQDVTELYHLDAAKREFVSLASHQLRTPASGVKAFLSLLHDGYGGTLNPTGKKFVKQAVEANERQLEVIDNLLSLASIESGKMTIRKEPVNLNDLIKRCVRQHQHLAKRKQQKITFKETYKQLQAEVDPIAFQMVVDNLVSNALKYSPDKKTVSITTRKSRGMILIEVIDRGIGIARKNIPMLFEKFSRIHDPASKTVGGSGLGLYTAKHIVELHGGAISVRSSRKNGTTFTIKLPENPKHRTMLSRK